MSSPDLAPRSPMLGIVAVWAAGLVSAIVIGTVASAEQQFRWLCIALAGCVILAFAIQVLYARPAGFVRRVGVSLLGAMLAMGLVSLALTFAAMTTAA